MFFSKNSLTGNITTGRAWLLAVCLPVLQACAYPAFNAGRMDPDSPSIYRPGEQITAMSDYPAVTLTELLASALERHPSIMAADADRRAALADVRIAGALMDPQLSITQGITDTDQQTLALEQRLPLFGQRGLAAEQAEQLHRAASAQWRQARSDVARDLLKTYAEYAYIGTAQAIMAQQIALLEQVLEVSRTQYTTGSGTQADLLRMESEKEQLVNQHISLSNMLPVAGARLNAALGRLPGSPLPSPQLQLLPIPLGEQAPVAAQIFGSPQLQQLQHELAAADAAQRLAGRTGFPDLMIGVEQMRNGNMGGSETSLMLGINLPIWRGRYQAQKQQAQSRHHAVGERTRDRYQKLEAEVRMALFSLDEAQRNQRLYAGSLVPRGEQAFRVTLSSYRSGVASFADLIASQREWLSFELNRERSLADAMRWQGELMALLGVDTVLPALEENR